jgi:hypothetical protein
MGCLWASARGAEAVKATGHPKSLQVKERLLSDAALDVLSDRVFAPEALDRLRDALEAEEPPADPRRVEETSRRCRAS